MENTKPVVITIGYGRHLFVDGNDEQARMRICAAETASLSVVIFSRREDSLAIKSIGEQLALYPTNSVSKFTMLFDAYRLAAGIIKSSDKSKCRKIIVTTQDPFETALIGYALKLHFGVKLVIQEHGDVFSLDFWRHESWGNQVRFLLGKWLLRRADVVRVVSKRIEKTMRDKVGVKNKITRLPVAIELGKFEVVRPQASPLQTQLASPSLSNSSDTFTLLTVARFVPQKNFPLLLKAFFSAYEKCPHLRLRIVGRGEKEDWLKKEIAKRFPLASTASPVSIEDWSDDVAALMRSADVYILSSNYEGWGRVLIEAMVSGLPCITTDVGCAGEVFEHEVHGLITPVADDESLSNAILQMATNKDFYTKCKEELAAIKAKNLAGVGTLKYGQAWVKTLG